MRGRPDDEAGRQPGARPGRFSSHADEIAYLMGGGSSPEEREEALALALAAVRQLLADLEAGVPADPSALQAPLSRIEQLLEQAG